MILSTLNITAARFGPIPRADFTVGRSFMSCIRFWARKFDRDRLGRGPAFRFNLAMERRVARKADAVIVLGEKVKEVMIAEKGVDPARLSVIYPGIDLAEYDRRQCRQRSKPSKIITRS